MMLVNYKNQLFKYLQMAVELEHSTIPPYLTALFTIGPDDNMEAWQIIRSVVMEEMLHMTLACNILNAVGGSPAIDDPRFVPSYPVELDFKPPKGKDRKFEVQLLPFSKKGIDIFLDIEMPKELLPTNLMAFNLEQVKEMDIPGLTIGEFYHLVELTLEKLCHEYGEENVFSGDPALQVGPEHYYGSGGEILKVHNLKTAKDAMELIVEQGEGAPEDIWDGDHTHFGQEEEVAHYFRFNEIKKGQYYQEGDDPKSTPTGPKMNIDWDAVKPMIPNPKAMDFPPGSPARELATEFNMLYSQFLGVLHDTFNGQPDKMRQSVGMMWQLKHLSEALLNIEVSENPRQVAGPPFEYVHKSLRKEQKQPTVAIPKAYSVKPGAGPNPLPTIPEGFKLPFFYSSLYNVAVFYEVPVEQVQPYLEGTGLRPAIFEEGQAVVTYNFQHYTGQFGAGSSITQEVELNILSIPESLYGHSAEVSFRQFVLGDDQTKVIGNHRVWVPCDSPLAIKAGKELFGEPKFLTSFEVDMPSLNGEGDTGKWNFTIKGPDDAPGDICTVKVDISNLEPETSYMSPITEYGKHQGKLIGCRWNILQPMPAFFLRKNQSDRATLTLGNSKHPMRMDLEKLLGDAPPAAVRVYASAPVATQGRAYFP